MTAAWAGSSIRTVQGRGTRYCPFSLGRDAPEGAAIPAGRKAALLALPKEDLLRQIVDNVDKRGQAGQDRQKVISVAMLSEGWDAKSVTHIMGLRAFTSQLLCEPVIVRSARDLLRYTPHSKPIASAIERARSPITRAGSASRRSRWALRRTSASTSGLSAASCRRSSSA